MSDFKKVRVIEYTGTIDSYNQLVDHLWDRKRGYYHIWFIDEKGEMTPKFTGIVMDTLKGIRYKPGDSYCVELNDE